jgi:FkbM family methyltransferase
MFKRILKTLFLIMSHYSHAIMFRSFLSSEYMFFGLNQKGYPKGMLYKIWKNPEDMEDLIHFSRFINIRDKVLLIDVGANTGYWAASFLEVFPNTQVEGFEPDYRASKKHKDRFLSFSNVNLHKFALSSAAGSQDFIMRETNTFSGFDEYAVSPDSVNIQTSEVSKVEKCRLDDVPLKLNGYDKVVLKVDVQGHELEVLKGSMETLKAIDIIMIELSFAVEYIDIDPSFSEISALLNNSGHHPIIFQNHGRSLSPYAWERDVIFVKKELLDCIWGD